MTAEETFYGFAYEQSISANTELVFGLGRVQVVTPTVGSLDVTLPDATTLPHIGGPIFVVVNGSNLFSFSVKDNGGNAIMGGISVGTDEAATVHLIDQSTANGTWRVRVESVGSASNPQSAASSFIPGGTTDNDSCWEYDQQIDKWTQRGDIGFNLDNAASFSIGNLGYVCGNSNSPRDKCYSFNPPNTWTAKNDMSIDQSYHMAVGPISDKGYTFGGTYDTDATEEFDGTNWTTKTNRTNGGKYGSAAIVSDIAYVINGTTVNQKHDAFDPSGNSWTGKADHPLYMRAFPAFEISDTIIAVMGSDDLSSLYDDVFRYQPQTDTWKAQADFPYTERFKHAGWSAYDKGYITFGQDTGKDETYQYTVDTWTAKTDFPTTGKTTATNHPMLVTR